MTDVLLFNVKCITTLLLRESSLLQLRELTNGEWVLFILV